MAILKKLRDRKRKTSKKEKEINFLGRKRTVIKDRT